MKLASLRFRLFLLSLLSILLALAATTLVLSEQFHNYFENRIFTELEQHLEQLTNNISVSETGEIIVAPMLDRRFEQPFSGLYWQVQEVGEPAHVSRSLWGDSIATPENLSAGAQFRTTARSPIGSGLLVSGWQLHLGENDTQRTLVLAVAMDGAEVDTAASGFRRFLIIWLAIMFAGLLLAAWAQVRIGLAPLSLLHKRIKTIRAGSNRRLSGHYPSEVKPLVDEVNELLDLHENTIATARARASDLAHGLKTPLTVMRSLAKELDDKGLSDESAEMEAQISSMHHFVERELARANTGFPTNAKTPVAPLISRMVASMKKLPRGRDLQWIVDIPDDVTSPFDDHDLSELSGNLLDNARKWAAHHIKISVDSDTSGNCRLKVCDDGPGIPKEKLEVALERGRKLDTTVSGTGLGLTIARDLVSHRGGILTLAQSEMGGLEVTVSW